MNSLMKKATIVFLVFLMLVGVVYALGSIRFWQNLTVTSGAIQLFTNSTKFVEIIPESTHSNFWGWNDDTKSFNTTIYVWNNGTSTVNIAVSSNINPPWTFDYQVIGGTTGLAPNTGRDIKLAVINPSAVSGTQTYSFSVTVSVV